MLYAAEPFAFLRLLDIIHVGCRHAPRQQVLQCSAAVQLPFLKMQWPWQARCDLRLSHPCPPCCPTLPFTLSRPYPPRCPHPDLYPAPTLTHSALLQPVLVMHYLCHAVQCCTVFLLYTLCFFVFSMKKAMLHTGDLVNNHWLSHQRTALQSLRILSLQVLHASVSCNTIKREGLMRCWSRRPQACSLDVRLYC